MFIKMRKGEQNKLVSKCLEKAGNDRKLSKILWIPKLSIYEYKNEFRKLPEERFIKMLKFLNLNINSELNKVKLLPNNFGQKKGGLKSYESKVKKGIFNKNLEKMKKSSSIRLSNWHKKMKKESKEQYYTEQFKRFKKIGQYKCITKNKEKVRNKLEENVANVLFDLRKDYKYEPYIETNKKVFFPDFLVGDKIIIECTMWRGFDKAIKLKEKISMFQKGGFKTIIMIDPKVEKFYNAVKDYTVNNLNNLRRKIDSLEVKDG